MNDRNRKKHKSQVQPSSAASAEMTPEGVADGTGPETGTHANDPREADDARVTIEPCEATGAPVATEDEWRAALETAVKQRDEYLSLAQRVQADFQNYKRRNEKARADGYDDGVRDLLTALLPIFDNLERAVKAGEEHDDASVLLTGVKMIERQFQETSGTFGLEEVPALHQPFDPELHNAVMRADEGEPGTVLEVFQKGYRARGRIIRYAMVKVAAD